MHDAVVMGVIEAGGDPVQVLQRGRRVELALVHPAGQAAAGHVLDDHVRRPLELAEVVDVDDVRMPHLGDRLGLVAEAGHRVRVGADRLHHLDRAGPLELRVIGAVDQTHGPLADEVLDLVLTQFCPLRDRHDR